MIMHHRLMCLWRVPRGVSFVAAVPIAPRDMAPVMWWETPRGVSERLVWLARREAGSAEGTWQPAPGAPAGLSAWLSSVAQSLVHGTSVCIVPPNKSAAHFTELDLLDEARWLSSEMVARLGTLDAFEGLRKLHLPSPVGGSREGLYVQLVLARPKLQTMTIGDGASLRVGDVSTLVHRLQSLTVHHARLSETTAVMFGKLRVLRLAWPVLVSGQRASVVLRLLTSEVAALDLDAAAWLTDASVEAAAREVRDPTLRVLHLRRCAYIGDRAVAALGAWPQLERLSLDGCGRVTGATLAALSTLECMSWLDLSATSVNLHGLYQLLAVNRALFVVCLRHAPVTAAEVVQALACHPSLAEVCTHHATPPRVAHGTEKRWAFVSSASGRSVAVLGQVASRRRVVAAVRAATVAGPRASRLRRPRVAVDTFMDLPTQCVESASAAECVDADAATHSVGGSGDEDGLP
jgi:hypothetical protein